VPADGHDLGSLDFAVCGAAPMPGELARRFEQATGIRILEAYGLTESACVSTLNPKSDARRGLVAELRLRQSSPALRAALGSYALAAEITEG
jgi:fatty-acyl-CoA synthase